MGFLTLAELKVEVRGAFGNTAEYDARLNNMEAGMTA